LEHSERKCSQFQLIDNNELHHFALSLQPIHPKTTFRNTKHLLSVCAAYGFRAAVAQSSGLILGSFHRDVGL
jgi:hypothetical protein